MNYSDLYLREQKKPPFIMFLFAIVAVMGLAALLLQPGGGTAVNTRASKKTVKAMEIMPISGKQVGVYWQSDTAEEGWLLYGKEKNNTPNTVLDVRDTDASRGKRTTHYVVIQQLTEESQYNFLIVSGREVVAKTDGSPFSFTTPGIDNGSRTGLKPAYGKVVNSAGGPDANALVVMRIPGVYPLAVVTRNSGEWLIPLQSVLSNTTGKGIVITEKDAVTITIYDERGAISQIETLVGKTNPLPETTIIGKDYYYINDVLGTQTTNTAQSSSGTSYPLDIIYPIANSVIPAVRPLLKGTGVPGTVVYASIDTTSSVSYRTTVRNDGTWNITVANSIAPGLYTLSVTLIDSARKNVILHREFSIAKSGEQVLGEATASANLTPTLVIPTAISSAPTTIITSLPATVSPTLFQTGFNSAPLAFISLAFIILGAGILFIFA